MRLGQIGNLLVCRVRMVRFRIHPEKFGFVLLLTTLAALTVGFVRMSRQQNLAAIRALESTKTLSTTKQVASDPITGTVNLQNPHTIMKVFKREGINRRLKQTYRICNRICCKVVNPYEVPATTFLVLASCEHFRMFCFVVLFSSCLRDKHTIT